MCFSCLAGQIFNFCNSGFSEKLQEPGIYREITIAAAQDGPKTLRVLRDLRGESFFMLSQLELSG